MSAPVVDEIRTWQRVRRYAVPAPMIGACTAAREAGDWRAACAAGRVDVAFDLADVAREHGRAGAERIEADLTVLAPDLLRWHLPRALGGRTSLATHQDYLLSTVEGRFAEGDVALVVSAPKTVDGSQRLRLAVRPALEDVNGRRDLPPVFWSAAHVDGLATAYGGSAARLPGFEADGGVRPFAAYPTEVDPADPASRVEVFDRYIAEGDMVGAWAATGVDLDPALPEAYQGYHPKEALDAARRGGVVPVRLHAELTRLHDRYGVGRAMLGERWHLVAGVRRRDDGGLSASILGFDQANFDHPRLATPVHTRPVDLELVRHGLVDPAELHPLVRRALFPAAPGGTLPAGPPDVRVSVPVRCRGEWHRVVHADGRLDPVSHTADEIAREELLRTLGGQVAGCFAVLQAWRGSGDRLPRPLRELRRDVLQRLQHGGAAALTELLDAGLEPRMTDGRGGTLLHQLRAVEDVTLVRRLVDAGIPVDAGDRRGRTPLHVAVGDGGTPELVHALLVAGADPQAPDADGCTVAELADGKASMYDEDEEFRAVFRIRDVVEEWTNR